MSGSYRVPEGFTLTPSATRAGNVDLSFQAKPSAEIREELKAAGFRWSGFSRCWYGPASRLPARYGSTPFEDAPPIDPDEDGARAMHDEGGRFTVEGLVGFRARTGRRPRPITASDLEGPDDPMMRDPGEDAADRWNEVTR